MANSGRSAAILLLHDPARRVRPACTLLAIGDSDAAAAIVADKRGGSIVRLGSLEQARDWIDHEGEGLVYLIGECSGWHAGSLLLIARAAAERGIVLGLIVGFGEEAVRAAARRLPATARVGDGAMAQPFFDGADIPAGRGGARSLPIGHGDFDADTVARLYRMPFEVAYISAHGNGLDFGLPGLSACRQGQYIARDDALFPCYFGEACGRGDGSRVLADEIGARRVVLASCWGYYLRGDFDPLASTGRGMIENGRLESLLTTIRVVDFDAVELNLLYYLVNDGRSWGEIARDINRLRAARGREADFLCFGDAESRLSRTILDLTATPGPTGEFTVAIDPLDGPIDLAVRTGLDQADFVLVRCEDAAVSGAIFSRDLLFLTVRPHAAGAAIRIGLEPRHFLVVPPEELAGLRRDVAEMAVLAEGAVRRHGETGRDLAQATEAARAILAEWPLRFIPPGSCLAAATVEGIGRALGEALDQVAIAAVDLHDALVIPHGLNHARHFWMERSPLIGETMLAEGCPYCGEPVVARRFALPGLASLDRQALYCHGCGPIADGPVPPGGGLHAPDAVACSSTIAVTIPIDNPSVLPRLAHVRLALESIDRRRSVLGPRTAILCPPQARVDLRLALDIPAEWTAGIHYLGGIVAMGARTISFRRGLRVQGRDATPRPRHPARGNSPG